MRLSSLSIRNFRSFRDQTIEFGNYTSLVGPNGSGKSTVLMALNILFRQRSNVATDVQLLTDEDFHNKNTSEPIVVEATFTDLSPEATETLKHYVRQGKLVIKARAEWNNEGKTAEVKHYGARLGIEDFTEFFEKHKARDTAEALNKIYDGLQERYSDLPKATSKDAKRTALREFEDAHPELCVLLDSEDQFFGFQGTGKLEPFLQWIYIPAVKDASSEQEEAKNTALGQLLDRTVRAKIDFSGLNDLEDRMKDEYQEVLDTQKGLLTSISSSLETKLKTWAHGGARIELKWNFDPQKSVRLEKPYARADVGERTFVGDIRRMGHGFQRAFIVSLLQELATGSPDTATLLLGFEEPELYQHPPQARYLEGLLERMENSQVIVTTHSPYFISGKGMENVRLVRWDKDNDQSVVSSVTLESLGRRIGEALGEEAQSPSYVMASVQQIMHPSLNELYFSHLTVFIEGPEDVAFISTHLELSGLIKDFRKVGAHLIACGGKNAMSRPLAIACEFGIPFFVVFDADSTDTSTGNIYDNRCILALCGCRDVDPLTTPGHVTDNVVMWKNKIKETVVEEIGQQKWDKAWEEMKAHYGSVSDKNEILIASTLENLYKDGISSAVLEGLCRKIIAWGSRHSVE
jgi:putative ATP-dependent endonuclease of OLD family